ncbi:MAG: selenoneine biosynthesis selenosugar synthase SenB [Pseudomonadota bacterium]
MKILLVTPAEVHSRNGNRTTANRWRKIFQSLGHSVTVVQKYQTEPADLMVAIHAWRSADAILKFSMQHPNLPIIVALSGTDAYQYINSHTDTTMRSILLADRLVGLHARIANVLPKELKNKVRVIYQSSEFLPKVKYQSKDFKVCVAGHLRDEKDPLRAAYAARKLPKKSKIRVHHYGKTHTYQWRKRARFEESRNPRYQWHGEVSHAYLKNRMRRSQILILSSIMEGGANIISEALAVELPVIASKIEGTVGLLGKNYPGYFETENTTDLLKYLIKVENDTTYLNKLKQACLERRYLFSIDQETLSWKKLLNEVCS